MESDKSPLTTAGKLSVSTEPPLDLRDTSTASAIRPELVNGLANVNSIRINSAALPYSFPGIEEVAS